ncbi:hemerythrin domain-containing protein [Musicola paradisiaca]|uniref:Hemerythrin-like domain-containing protein n=1 Tax=Musicola paradisiaca (strain Ech703) TaxID=579405 RepID=C6C5X9_MUSP7|nr:hemerythrin domain-containing protein [Musicola paradisiaca]ACS85770.1 conserved hypothetical protein [Musicola paradisiaca Ech703]
MDLTKFKHQHEIILDNISALRSLSKMGVTIHAHEIAKLIVSMSSTIKLHLSAEDRVLYPLLQQHRDSELNKMGKRYQEEMTKIAAEYDVFSRRWNTAASLTDQDDAFRQDANRVLRNIYERMSREDHDFYPTIESIE